MNGSPLDIVIFGLSITSAWGNGHATTYRSLTRALAHRGHRVTFFERDQPWYALHRDLPRPDWCEVRLYDGKADLEAHFDEGVPGDVVIIGSYVPDGIALAEWVLPRAQGLVAFYDIDTPVTLAALRAGRCRYLDATLIPRFDLYLSFAGGPALEQLKNELGARHVQPLYCSVDAELYFPMAESAEYDLAYLGTYSADRQPGLDRLLIDPARDWPQGRFCVAGAQYPPSIEWPPNVARIEHVEPRAHCRFYNRQRFALNLTRADMMRAGYSPSVRLFEAAACGVPVITDRWPGLESFFAPGTEILVADSPDDSLAYLRDLDAAEASAIGARAREVVLSAHTAAHRAMELETYVDQLRRQAPRSFVGHVAETVHGL